ncbi:hypothetical protein C8Q74DRAFT_1435196 [Fomes fomentarius]|nr:hypothetical protein C8Q74DRAFT_1435196 [Fomes fomentarius]
MPGGAHATACTAYEHASTKTPSITGTRIVKARAREHSNTAALIPVHLSLRASPAVAIVSFSNIIKDNNHDGHKYIALRCTDMARHVTSSCESYGSSETCSVDGRTYCTDGIAIFCADRYKREDKRMISSPLPPSSESSSNTSLCTIIQSATRYPADTMGLATLSHQDVHAYTLNSDVDTPQFASNAAHPFCIPTIQITPPEEMPCSEVQDLTEAMSCINLRRVSDESHGNHHH